MIFDSQNIKSAFRLLMAMMALSPLCSCINDDFNEIIDDTEHDGKVELAIRVKVNGEIPNQTIGESDRPAATRVADWYFEQPEIQTEYAVNTLRIIIVRPDAGNLVEHNSLLNLENINNNVDNLGYVRYKVEPDENKRVYLIANEATLSEDVRNSISSVVEESALPENFFNLTWSASESGALVDNSGASRSFIPMSEFFDFFIDSQKDAPNGITTVSKDLFLTRAVTKFRFVVEPWDDKSTSPVVGYKINKLDFLYSASKEYLFPHNTVYSPAKYSASSEPYGGRVINSFSTPDDVSLQQFTFNPTNFGMPGTIKAFKNLSKSFNPEIYLPECHMNISDHYYVSAEIQFDTDDDPLKATVAYSAIKLPNLSQLPRNTIVEVHIKVSPQNQISMTASLVPYYVVSLNPEFGFSDIIYHPSDYDDVTDEEWETDKKVEIDGPGHD